MLALLGAAGVLVVHRQTAVLSKGYRLSGLIGRVEGRKEACRKLRIALERERLPRVVRRRALALGIELEQPARTLYRDTASVREFYELEARTGGEARR